jgi:putative membrane protein
MEGYLLIKYLHYLGIFGIVSSLVTQHLLLRAQLYRHEIQRLARIDGVYGISVVLVLGAGLLMWFWVGKPMAYYNQNWIFHTKVFLFLIIGLLSLIPSVYFIRNKKGAGDELIRIPQHLKMIVRIELFLLLLLPLLAVLMAQGLGSF